MLLVSFKNFASWYNILQKSKYYDLNFKNLRINRFNKKPILPTKFFLTMSKKNVRNSKLEGSFILTWRQKLLLTNLNNFKKHYKEHLIYKKHKNNIRVDVLTYKLFKSKWFSLFNITLFKSKNVKSQVTFNHYNIKHNYLKSNKIYKFTYLKKRKRLKRLKFKPTRLGLSKLAYHKTFFFKRFKYKYGILRKKTLNKKLIRYYNKIKYHSKLRVKLKRYCIYNFNRNKITIKYNKKQYKKVWYRFKKGQVLSRSSYYVLPKLTSSMKFLVGFKKVTYLKFKLYIINSNYLDFKYNFLKTTLRFFSDSQPYVHRKNNVQSFFWKPNTKYVLMKTKHGSSFIIKNVGLIFPTKLLFKYSKFELYRIKKKMYSFLRKNEYRNHIFNFRKKQILWKNFFYNKKNFMSDLPKTSYNFFKSQFYFTSNFTQDQSGQFRSTNFVNDTIFSKNNFFYSKQKNRNNFFEEVRIPRIRFKPGYQKLWRGFRKALSELISYKYLYQKQLTRYLTRFYRKIHKNYISQEENSIDKILLYSKLLPDMSSLNSFFSNNMIFLNNTKLTNLSIFVYKNDFIQIEISNWYYIFSRWLFKLTKNRSLKFKRLIFKKGMSTKYKLMKQKKQRSNHTPNWIINSRYDFQDIKSFLEVDFMTLSLFIIYDYNYIFYYTPMDLKLINYNIYKMYNWKYIT